MTAGGELCHRVFLCQLYGSHYSRLLVTLLVHGSPSQGQDESGPPTQMRQVLEILSLFMSPGGNLVPVLVPRW